jgi:hypothetical protein
MSSGVMSLVTTAYYPGSKLTASKRGQTSAVEVGGSSRAKAINFNDGGLSLDGGGCHAKKGKY